MEKEKDQTETSWEDCSLPDEYPEPQMEDGAVLNGEADEGASATREETITDQSVKCSPNLLQILKAAESRWTPRGRDSNASEAETGELVTEALKTGMVSKHILTEFDQDIMCICKHTPQDAQICTYLGC